MLSGSSGTYSAVSAAQSGKPFTTLCLSNNARRLVSMAERHRRLVEDRPTLSPGWTEIWVGDYLA